MGTLEIEVNLMMEVTPEFVLREKPDVLAIISGLFKRVKFPAN
jgi:hypothetical protein